MWERFLLRVIISIPPCPPRISHLRFSRSHSSAKFTSSRAISRPRSFRCYIAHIVYNKCYVHVCVCVGLISFSIDRSVEPILPSNKPYNYYLYYLGVGVGIISRSRVGTLCSARLGTRVLQRRFISRVWGSGGRKEMANGEKKKLLAQSHAFYFIPLLRWLFLAVGFLANQRTLFNAMKYIPIENFGEYGILDGDCWFNQRTVKYGNQKLRYDVGNSVDLGRIPWKKLLIGKYLTPKKKTFFNQVGDSDLR